MLSLIEISPLVLEKKIFKFRQCIFPISFYFSLEKGGVLHLNKLESASPNDALCKVWLKLTMLFWSRFLNFFDIYFLFLGLLPLEVGVILHLY